MPANRVATQARITAHAVLEVLAQTLSEHRPADRCLHTFFAANHQLGSRDRRIISETLFSVLRWWGWLRHLAPASFTAAIAEGRELPALHSSDWYGVFSAAWLLENRFMLPPSVMSWLREAGLYPELFADIPTDTPVIMRRKYLLPFFRKQKMPALPIEALLPEWIAAELAPEEEVDFNQLVNWMQRRPPMWLRTQNGNPQDIAHIIANESEGSAKPIPAEHLPNAFAVQHAAANFRALPCFKAGKFEIQDQASQCVAFVAAPKPGEQWWDACAGGGGKSLHLAALMKGRGTILASDLRESALEELKLRARRGNFSNIRLKTWKGDPAPQYDQRFDGVLVDVPCSCSGTWRRTPDGRWNSAPEQIDKFAELQLQLLTNAAAAVKPGGTLVYSTCSMFRKENQAVVEKFLLNDPNFVLAPHTNPIDGKPGLGMCQIWPWQGDCDAMFTAKMTRRITK